MHYSRESSETRCFPAGKLFVVFGLFLISCGGAQPQPTQLPVDASPPPDTTLGPGDVFDVRVYGEKDLSSTFRVASDGTIDYPLLGTVQVNKMTPTEVVKVLEGGLKDGEFLKKPQVSIFVKEYNSKKVFIFGQVKKPGTFPYQEGMSVVEAISIAGGFTAMARGNDTTVTRIVDGKKKRFGVPVEEIGQGKAANFVLRPGDILFVPERIF
ncbi:MAG: polysaccharide export protein [Proteobacteria bacterium]|nr:polysaccharide export protein [Pseudomonadota bacterium]